jgi:hypothetical protein
MNETIAAELLKKSLEKITNTHLATSIGMLLIMGGALGFAVYKTYEAKKEKK